MLLLAATTASALNGALVMAAFGVGTLPAMVSATIAFERAAKLLASRATLRNVAGSLLLAFGAWTAGSALYHLVAHGAHGGGSDHDMSSMGDPADPHAGHDMSATGNTADPHAGHDMGATGDPADARAGHDTDPAADAVRPPQ
jgi:hypothetical protein